MDPIDVWEQTERARLTDEFERAIRPLIDDVAAGRRESSDVAIEIRRLGRMLAFYAAPALDHAAREKRVRASRQKNVRIWRR